MKEYIVDSVTQTQNIAMQLAHYMEGKKACILLKGDLGAGKTTFTKALGEALGVSKVINSPTFTILKSYKMRDQRILYHIDAYRLEGMSQDLGFDEIFDEDAISVVEWPHFIQECLPNSFLSITIKVINGDKRSLQFEMNNKSTVNDLKE